MLSCLLGLRNLNFQSTAMCEIAKEQGYKLIRVDCSSNFSARAMAKLGFESISELKYEDYKPNGEIVFKPAFPHTEVKSFVWRL
ncbi:dopamine N-acetyltransferase-like [Agrilus planipennis]|uniref:Dopamine N-acetyltransferase-like n=1 Tax=Agrilus planipennis TaxID=224129 RepID=A0A1W4WIK6_AGRPL|nr:dopamine N-acetyltransferase-like [Agrilus planipennis]